jgi:hypothetical protein
MCIYLINYGLQKIFCNTLFFLPIWSFKLFKTGAIRMKATMEGAVLFLLLALPSAIDGRKMIDLTHTFDKDAPKYPLTWLGAENFTYYRLTPLLKRYYDDMW